MRAGTDTQSAMVPHGKLPLLALLLTPACKDAVTDMGDPDTGTAALETSTPAATGETPTTGDSSTAADPICGRPRTASASSPAAAT
jgi:hypothetical protein